MEPIVSVVIPTYKRPQLLTRCLDALIAQEMAPDAFEVIVVDDGNDADTRAAVEAVAARSALNLRYLGQPERRGPAAARNRGWRAAKSPVIGFTDDDCIPAPDWISQAVEAFRNGAQVISGRVRVPLRDQPTEYEKITSLLETAEFVTANCFCRRAALEAVGGLEERFDIAWREDSDLQFKFLEKGIPIEKRPEALILHPVRTSPWWASLKDERKNAYDALLYKRHPRLFRERIPRYLGLVTLYYAVVISFLVGVGLGLAGEPRGASAAFGVWAVCMVVLVGMRLQRSDWAPASFVPVLMTSVLTPFLSVYWRLYGAFKYRTLYW
ncbi:glycosyltransferase family 2 protein [Larkinella soli]|uniref:glycosyltransferase family 2 protein n=1 Tax=Larkinella soli TaxID=1770527 RepID=UPI000FFBB155|nr:glycosyltransferase [Larkinella soli]